MARDGRGDGTSQLWRSITTFLLIFRPEVLYDYYSAWNSASESSIKKVGERKSNSAHRSPFVTTNFPSRFFFNLKWVSRIAHPTCFLHPNEKVLFYCFFYLFIPLREKFFNTEFFLVRNVFGLNTEIYGVNFRFQSECREKQTRKNSVFGHFSCSEHFVIKIFK